MKLIILKIKRLAHTPGNCYRAGDRNTSGVATRRAVDVVYGGRHCSGAIFKKLIYFLKNIHKVLFPMLENHCYLYPITTGGLSVAHTSAKLLADRIGYPNGLGHCGVKNNF